MALELSTAGIKVMWAVESSAGSRPTTGYARIRGVKSIPEFNPEPSSLEVTDLGDTEWKRYIPGLKDPGGAIGLTVNDFVNFRTDWNAMLTAFGNLSDGKQLWIQYVVPGMDSFYFPAIPSELGFGGAEVDSVLENAAYLTPNGAPVFATASSGNTGAS